MVQLNVLICGGGVSGNALAFWLCRLGHKVTVVEHFSALRVTGLQIDLRGHGIEVLKRMGLEKEGRARTVQEHGMEMVDASGRIWGYFPVNRSGGPQGFSSEFEIMRGDMCQLLYDAAKEGTKYIFGQTVQTFEEKDDHVEVTFSGGSTERFDLLIGADGIGSRIRKLFIGSDTKNPVKHLGMHIGYFTIPKPAPPGTEYRSTIFLAPGQRMTMVRRHNDDQLQVYMACRPKTDRLENARKLGVEEQKAALTEIYRGTGWKNEEFLSGLKESDNFYCEQLGVVELDSWHSRRVVLAGDAAHCPTATTGMGTTSSIVGAYILAGEIHNHCQNSTDKDALTQALKEYDQKFRPFMTSVQYKVAEGSTLTFMPASNFGITVVLFISWLASILKLNLMGEYLLREKVHNWTLPEYKEMLKTVHERST